MIVNPEQQLALASRVIVRVSAVSGRRLLMLVLWPVTAIGVVRIADLLTIIALLLAGRGRLFPRLAIHLDQTSAVQPVEVYPAQLIAHVRVAVGQTLHELHLALAQRNGYGIGVHFPVGHFLRSQPDGTVVVLPAAHVHSGKGAQVPVGMGHIVLATPNSARNDHAFECGQSVHDRLEERCRRGRCHDGRGLRCIHLEMVLALVQHSAQLIGVQHGLVVRVEQPVVFGAHHCRQTLQKVGCFLWSFDRIEEGTVVQVNVFDHVGRLLGA